MAGTEQLPGIGKVKKGWIWGGIGITAVIVGYAYIKHRDAGAASTAPAAAAAAIDPATGYPQGSPQDIAALQAQAEATSGSGGSGYEDEYGGTSGSQLYYDPADGLYDLTSPYTGTTTGTTPTATANTGPGTFTDDAYWVSYAEQAVTGYPASAIQGALSAYLAGIPLTTTQMSIYQAALAVAGPPPSPGPTPVLATQSTSGTPQGSSSAPGGPITSVPGNFRAEVSGLAVTLTWSPVVVPSGQGPLRGYTVAYGQSASSLPYTQQVGATATSTTITFNSGAGSKGLTHYFEVWADPAATNGPHAGPISAKTT